MPPRGKDERASSNGPGKGKKNSIDKESEEYIKRRERNNVAVRRSRDKSRKKAAETVKLVKKLRSDNEYLEQKVKLLSKELSLLRDLFLTHTNNKPYDETSPIEVNKDALQKDHEYTLSRKIVSIKTEDMGVM